MTALGVPAEVLRFDLLIALILAVVLGGAVGVERELRGKSAGLRTNILICVGSVLFTDLSLRMAGPTGDPARIAAQIVTGVGFIGAGTIIHGRGSISGLTSAATIWIVAAIGMALGFGGYVEAVGATLLVFLVLSGLGWVERFLSVRGEAATIAVEIDDDPEVTKQVEGAIRESGLDIDDVMVEQTGRRVILTVHMIGSRAQQNAAKLALLRVPGAHRVAVVK